MRLDVCGLNVEKSCCIETSRSEVERGAAAAPLAEFHNSDLLQNRISVQKQETSLLKTFRQ